MEHNANYYEDDFLEKTAKENGTSWGRNCWKEAKKDHLKEFEKLSNDTQCHQDIVCHSCCDRKEKNCAEKYPQKEKKCGTALTWCVDVLKKT